MPGDDLGFPVSRNEQRPWGASTVLAGDRGHKVRLLTVLPGKRTSLQRHSERAEHWYVVSGQAWVDAGDDHFPMLPGDTVDIPEDCWHRIENTGKGLLSVVEILWGHYLGEDDIERKEDDFGRPVSRDNEPFSAPTSKDRFTLEPAR